LLQYQRRLNHVHFFTTSAKASYENIVAAMGPWLMVKSYRWISIR
jgi:hypothetical protein